MGRLISSLRILVVDDNADVAKSLALLLKVRGHQTQVANGCDEALQVAQHFRPEVIFVDLGMPGKDGFRVAMELRELAVCDGVLLISISGWGTPLIRARSKAAGFAHHLTKPAALADIEPLLVDRAVARDGPAASDGPKQRQDQADPAGSAAPVHPAGQQPLDRPLAASALPAPGRQHDQQPDQGGDSGGAGRP